MGRYDDAQANAVREIPEVPETAWPKVRKFHALRHTSATLLLYSGVNIRQVQSRLGHGNITTTQRYLHAIKDADEEAVNALQNLLITQHKADAEAKRKAE